METQGSLFGLATTDPSGDACAVHDIQINYIVLYNFCSKEIVAFKNYSYQTPRPSQLQYKTS